MVAGMSLEEMLIAHWIIGWLLPDELEELADLLECLPGAAPASCGVPLLELRAKIVVELGEEHRAVQQLTALLG